MKAPMSLAVHISEFNVSAYNRRVHVMGFADNFPSLSLFLTADEARAFATKLMNAAVQATPMVELEDAA